MVHHVCHACKRSLDSEDVRFVVRMEVYEALGQEGTSADDDRDYLGEIHDYLERFDEDLDDREDELFGRIECQSFRFSLCGDCRKSFVHDPLGRRTAQPLDFSQN